MRGCESQAATKHGTPQAFKPDVFKNGGVVQAGDARHDPGRNGAFHRKHGLKAGFCEGVQRDHACGFS